MQIEQTQKRPYFSIVMPTYNVEAYIDEAIRSILRQTFEDFELIVVNDAATDRSAEKARAFAEKDGRIRIAEHKENLGLSAARNTGIEAAAGRYIWFMDPDDTADDDLLMQVFTSVTEDPADLVLFGLKEEYYDTDGSLSYRHTILPKRGCAKTKEEVRARIPDLERQTLYGYAWNKFYLLSRIKEKKLTFEKVALIEDILFNIRYCMDISTMNLLGIAPYHYAKRRDANLTNKFVPNYYGLHRERIRQLFYQQIVWKNDTEEVRALLGGLYARYILSALQRNCDKRAGYTHEVRKSFCCSLFNDQLYLELIPHAAADTSRALRLWIRLLRMRRVGVCLFAGRCLHLIRNRVPRIYNKTKSGR